jgi:hypothetical protein
MVKTLGRWLLRILCCPGYPAAQLQSTCLVSSRVTHFILFLIFLYPAAHLQSSLSRSEPCHPMDWPDDRLDMVCVCLYLCGGVDVGIHTHIVAPGLNPYPTISYTHREGTARRRVRGRASWHPSTSPRRLKLILAVIYRLYCLFLHLQSVKRVQFTKCEACPICKTFSKKCS